MGGVAAVMFDTDVSLIYNQVDVSLIHNQIDVSLIHNQVDVINTRLLSFIRSDRGLVSELGQLRNFYLMASPTMQVRGGR